MKFEIRVNGKYSEDLDFVRDIPKMFKKGEGKLILNSRNIVRSFPELGFVAKEFHKINFINKFVYSYLRKSKAQRSYEYAQRLIENGFGSPEPVAYINVKSGPMGLNCFPMLLRTSFYICRECTWDSLYNVLNSEPSAHTEVIVKAYVADVLRMHDCGIAPIDTNPGNVFYKIDGNEVHFQYIDLNRMHLFNGGASLSARSKSLSRITNNDSMFEHLASMYFNLHFAGDAGKVEDAMNLCRSHREKFFAKQRMKDSLKKL